MQRAGERRLTVTRKPAYEETSVSVDRSMAQIRKLLARYDARIIFAEHSTMFEVGFMLKKPKNPGDNRDQWELPVRLQFSIERVFERLVQVHPRTDNPVLRERAMRTAWRQAYHYLKATLEAVDLGIFTIYQGLLAGFVGRDGRPMGVTVAPYLEEWAAGNTLGLLPPGDAGDDDDDDVIDV